MAVPTVAQVWLWPAEMAVTPVVKPKTCWGAGTQAKPPQFPVVMTPAPSWPWVSSPQHHAPPFTIAQVCSKPAVTAVALLVRPETCTGEGLLVKVEPFPSWPL
jgi:hypothetical protein